jgi:hypothetical protein
MDYGAKMTHDKLLEKFSNLFAFDDKGHALRAVVELHHPSKDKCWECSFPLDSIYVPYPCPTIQAITEELA